MRLALAFLSLCVALTAGAQEKTAKKKAGGYPPTIEGTKSETYRKVGDTELKLWIFDSRQKMTERPLPAIVFFFGGGSVKIVRKLISIPSCRAAIIYPGAVS